MKKTLFVILAFLLSLYMYVFFTNRNFYFFDSILKDTETEEVNIYNYSIFGTRFNIDGCLNTDLTNPSLVLKDEKSEINLESFFYKKNGRSCFYVSENYNDGIFLDNLKIGSYLLLIKDIDKNKKTFYYTLKNNTNYGDLEYYTITKNNSNNKISIEFDNYNNKNYISFIIKETKLPKDIYDISIDPGHGGEDRGAIGNLGGKIYNESDLNLKVALLVKKHLEDLGLKIKITRNKDITLQPYGNGGRALIANDHKTKYSFSIHFNSSYGIMEYGGVEIYTPNNINLTLAKLLANNLSEVVGYSKNPYFKIDDGVYYKYFMESDIEYSAMSLKSEGMEPYDITINSPYMYMIREVGGIHTYAYIDGRNDYYGLNSYYNFNQTAEPYLLELGYINYKDDLLKAIETPELFSQAINKSIKQFLNIS